MSDKDVDVTVDVACDPTFEVCDSAGANDTAVNATNGSNASNASNDSAPAAGGDAAAADAAGDDAPAAATASTEALIWGVLQAGQLLGGVLLYSSYNSLATDLASGKTSSNSSNWTASWIKSQAPISNWFTAAYIQIGLYSLGVTTWVLQLAGQDSLFATGTMVSLAYPVVQMIMAFVAYSGYTACSSTTSTQWDGSTTSVTQQVSCSSYTATSYIPTKVNDDGYSTWLILSIVGALSTLGSTLAFSSKFKDVYGSSSDDADEDADDSAADADAAAVDAADANATNGSNATNATDNSTDASADVSVDVDGDDATVAVDGDDAKDADAKADDKEDKKEEKKCTGWYCL